MAEWKDKKITGRPTKYTVEIAEKILARIADGKTLNAICREKGFPPHATVRHWVEDNRRNFGDRFRFARKIGFEAMADGLIEISDTDKNPQRAKIRVDARKWYLSKLAPKNYGERLEMRAEHSGELVIRWAEAGEGPDACA